MSLPKELPVEFRLKVVQTQLEYEWDRFATQPLPFTAQQILRLTLEEQELLKEKG